MQIGERVSIELVGVIKKIHNDEERGVMVDVEYAPFTQVFYVPAGACTPIGKAEEVPNA